MKNYSMSEEELVIHRIINDTRAKFNQLEIEEVVQEIAKLNFIRSSLSLNGIDFAVAINSYRNNLLKHIEEM